jgi:hypothetical protein
MGRVFPLSGAHARTRHLSRVGGFYDRTVDRLYGADPSRLKSLAFCTTDRTAHMLLESKR